MEMLLPPPVKKALVLLKEAGFAAYAVGGCVRDRVLGLTPHDYDICTAATPAQMQQVFVRERTLETGLKHGTLTVLLDGMPLEITTFRLDGIYRDGRHPDQVSFTTSIIEDLSRRDFTMNAMAYSPWDGLVDPFEGQKDCEKGIIRCVGEAARRFDEDALRILRALRFSARLGFPIEETTALAIHQQKGNLQKISKERIFAEMSGLLMGDDVKNVLSAFSDVIFSLFPILCPSEEKAAAAPAWQHALCLLSHLPKDETLRWTAFLQSNAASAGSVLRELKASSLLTAQVTKLIAFQAVPLKEDYMQEMLMRLGKDMLEKLLLLQRADKEAEQPSNKAAAENAYQKLRGKMERLLAENACYTLKQLAVNGQDIAGLGFRGPQIGEVLQALLMMVVSGKAMNDRETLMALALGRQMPTVTIPRL